jgi:hypothetical protein
MLVRELSSATRDPLSALSALSAVSELAAGQGELASQMLSAVLGTLPTLLGEPMLRPGALRAAAMLLRETLEAAAGNEPTPMSIDGKLHARKRTSGLVESTCSSLLINSNFMHV